VRGGKGKKKSPQLRKKVEKKKKRVKSHNHLKFLSIEGRKKGEKATPGEGAFHSRKEGKRGEKKEGPEEAGGRKKKRRGVTQKSISLYYEERKKETRTKGGGGEKRGEKGEKFTKVSKSH